MRCGQPALCDAAPDRRTDAEILPQSAGGQHDAEFEDLIHLDLGDLRGSTARDGHIFVEYAVDAVDQALQGGAVELVGTAGILHDARLGALGGSVPGALGQGVVDDRRAVAVVSLGDPQIRAQRIARQSLRVNGRIAKSCVRGFKDFATPGITNIPGNQSLAWYPPTQICLGTANPGLGLPWLCLLHLLQPPPPSVWKRR